MPNHIPNHLTITGPVSELKKIQTLVTTRADKAKEVEENIFDLDKIVPMPAKIFRGNIGEAEEKKYGKENCWYDWSVKHWGTKWNTYDQMNVSLHGTKTNGTFHIEFNTAWSPPIPAIKALARQFPKVEMELRYADEGGSFAGVDQFKGKMHHDGCVSEGEEFNELMKELLGYDPETGDEA